MKKLFLLFALGFILINCGGSQKGISKAKAPANPVDYATTITADELKEMLYIYASDEFEGRETGQPGQRKAAEYLKTQYQNMGIKSPLSGDDYFQEVPLEKQKVAEAYFTVNGKTFLTFEDQITLALPGNVAINTKDMIYAGYGIDHENYSDYKDLDVTGKVVLVKSGEPKDVNGNYVTSKTFGPTNWTNGRQSLYSKRDAAKKNGAKAILFMDNGLFYRYSPYFKSQAESGSTGRLSLKSNEESMLFMIVNENLGKALYANILEDDTPKVINTDLSITAENKSESVISENVVAFIEGSEKPDEIVVISAHLDHEGIKNGEVYNGADDDGSGTIALLEIAEAFKMAANDGNAPKRSILFLHVTGEERGLLGSKHYTDNDPIFPLENTVADLNIDMVGRTDPKRKDGDRNYVYLIGSDKLSTDLHNISEDVNQKYCNIELDYKYNDENDPNRFYYRSDHYNFAKNNIPVIFYFNGTHDDYHQPSDTPDKIEYDLLENRTRLIFHTAWELANRDERIVVDKAKQAKP
ncbi:MAG: M28 family peptidase [Bacteroidota bacterium]